jgi:ABC-type multidrug transport system ATPase subunit
MLHARGLTKYYSAITGVRDVNFLVRPGEVLGLLGPNGSGKFTTVGMLTGLLDPSGGVVTFDGSDIHDDLLAYKARLGYVPEEAQLYTWMSGDEHLRFCARLRGLAPAVARRRIDRLLDAFGLTGDRGAPMSAYSKGMRQKILWIVRKHAVAELDAIPFDADAPDGTFAGFNLSEGLAANYPPLTAATSMTSDPSGTCVSRPPV